MKHSPQIELTAAKRALADTRDACPHWDCESEGEGYDCCYAVDDAKRRVQRALRAFRPSNA